MKSSFNSPFIAACIGLALAMGLSMSANGQTSYTLSAASEDGLREFPPGSGAFTLGWGYGSVMVQSAEDRTIMDFNLGSLPQGANIYSATLNFFIQNQNGDGLTRLINLYTFYGESSVQATDWSNGNYYGNTGDAYGIHNLDVTSAVQSALGQGQDLLDFRMSAGTPSVNVFIDPSWRSGVASLTVIVAPEPGIMTLLACGAGLLCLRPRKKLALN